MIGNIVGAGYYLLYFWRGKSMLSIRLKDVSRNDKVCSSVLVIGVPASLGSLLMSVSQIVVNGQMSAYGDMALAGIGVAMKVTMITGMVCIGLGQGVQPLLGYCVGARLWERYQKILKFSLLFAFALSTVLTSACYLCLDQIIHAFLTDQNAFAYALRFARILLSTSFLFGVFYVLTNSLQAMGAAKASLIISLSRQGLIYIPALFLLQAAVGVNGLVWAQPLADVLSIILAVILCATTTKQMMRKPIETEGTIS